MATPRRTQEERTTATRRALLDATVECLVEYGYHGTTTTRVVERAGVSRGAQVHHFPTKTALVLAAVQHLATKRANGFIAGLHGSADWAGDLLDLLWDAHQGPLFEASMELWIAARTDAELRDQVAAFERMVTTGILDLARRMIGSDRTADPEFRADVHLAMETIRGLRLVSFVHPTSEEQLDARWQRTRVRLHQVLAPEPSGRF